MNDHQPLGLGIIGTGLAIEKLHWPALRQMPGASGDGVRGHLARQRREVLRVQRRAHGPAYGSDYAEMLGARRRRRGAHRAADSTAVPGRAGRAGGGQARAVREAGRRQRGSRAVTSWPSRREFPTRKILIAENFFYRPEVLLARSLLDDGAIGRLHLMTWRQVLYVVPREGAFASTPWRIAPQYRGGPQLDAGVHHIAQIRMLCGDIQDVQAFVQYANPTTGGPTDMTLNMHFVSQAIGSYVGRARGRPAAGRNQRHAAVRYTRACSRWATGASVCCPPTGRRQEHAVESDNGYFNQLQNFYDAIVYDEPIVGTIAQSLPTCW